MWWVRVDDTEAAGGLHVRQREAGERGLGQNPKNRAPVAQFWACRVKRRGRVMLGGGGYG